MDQKGFVQIPILIAIIVGVLVLSGVGYFGAEQYKNYQAGKIEKEKIAEETQRQRDLEIGALKQEVETLKKQPIVQPSPVTTSTTPVTITTPVITPIAQSSIQPPTSTFSNINGCGTYASSGNYQLNRDILATNPGCLKISGATNLTLDCQGHAIEYTANGISVSADKNYLYTDSATDYSAPLVDIQNSQNSSIKNCTLETDGQIPLSITGSRELTVSNNVINESPYFTAHVSVNSSDKITFMSNNVHVYYEQMKTNHSDIKDNNFLWQQPSKMNKTYINSVVELSNGSYNVVENNTINGSADGVCCDRRIGADHSIGLINESNDVVSQNKASNNWFLGMETVGRIENSLIDNNFIDNTGAGGIGSVYLTSWINNTVSNNQVNDSGLLFNFDRENGLLANESAIYFKDNNFINNSFRNYNGFGEGNSASFHFQPPFSLQTSAERQPAASEIILSNNLFQENDFNKNQPAPIFYPVGMVKDGGGNICGKSNIVPYPLSCN